MKFFEGVIWLKKNSNSDVHSFLISALLHVLYQYFAWEKYVGST